MPTERVAIQASAGHLRDGEAGVGRLPRQNVTRVTASAVYHRPFGNDRFWATTVAFGVKSGLSNIPTGLIDQATDAFLFESSIATSVHDPWFTRVEVVGKPAHDFHADEFIPTVFTVGKLQLGYVRYLAAGTGLSFGIGDSVNASIVPPLLAPRYDGRIAPGFGVFLHVRPSGEQGGSHHATTP
jgi:hypothetical protein